MCPGSLYPGCCFKLSMSCVLRMQGFSRAKQQGEQPAFLVLHSGSHHTAVSQVANRQGCCVWSVHCTQQLLLVHHTFSRMGDTGPYTIGEKVLVPHTDKFYEAKILKAQKREDGLWYYLLHYTGTCRKSLTSSCCLRLFQHSGSCTGSSRP